MFDAPVAAPPNIAADQTSSLAPTRTELLAPRLSLASCVRAYVIRSTLGVDLSPPQRYNYFPASHYCSITWILHGESIRIRLGDATVHEPLPTVSFIGAHTEPCVSANPGPVHALMMVLLPQALQALTGLDLAAMVNRVVPLESVLDAQWQAMAQAVQHASDDRTRVQLIEAFLEPRWNAVRQEAMPRGDRQRYWVESLALQAATSGIGKSLRQMERRIKNWVGLPLRDLRRLARSEESFLETRATYLSDPSNGPPNWAEVAAYNGYSDQSHLCRETRRSSGLTPNELKRAVAEEESFWVYRIWD